VTLGELVASARRAKGREWTQAKLTDALHKAGVKVSRGWVANLETDRVRSLNPQEIAALAHVLGKPENYFAPAPSADFVADAPIYGTMKHVPVVGVVGAAEFMFNFDDPPLEWLPTVIQGSASRRYAAFRISGDCMEPRFHDGEIVIVAETETIPDGVPGVFRLDAHCTLKVPFRHADRVELRPLNPKFKSIDVRSNKMVAVGVVIGVWRKP
jgi:SOS-response transcriptional repressor LexA